MKFLDNNGLEYLADKITGLISGGGSADFIVEQGTSGIWTYRKWASGIAECWYNNYNVGSCAFTNGPYGTGTGHGAYYLWKSDYMYPSNLFIEAPNISVSTFCGTGLLAASVYHNTSSVYSIYLWNTRSETLNNVKINGRAIGLWKTFTPTEVPSNYSPSVDYIFERGTSGIWVYRKWNSGLAECWGVWGGQLTHYATVASGLYGYYTTMGLPAIFDSSVLPVIQVTAGVGAGFAWSGAYMPNSYTGTSFNIYAVSGLSGTQTVTFNMSVKGRWKPW